MTPQLPVHLTAWLRRANVHPFRSRLLLSGSTLIATLCPTARTPNDIDYVVTGAYDAATLTRTVQEIVAVPDAYAHLHLGEITEIYEYTVEFPGLRAEVARTLPWNMPEPFLVDFAFGDPLTVAPRTISVPHVGSVLAVAPESLFAWKVHALVQFGADDWRPKDLYDLHVLWTQASLQKSVLAEAIDIAFSSRDSTLDELDDVRTNDDWGMRADGPRRWSAFAATYQITPSFQVIRAQVRDILDQLLS